MCSPDNFAFTCNVQVLIAFYSISLNVWNLWLPVTSGCVYVGVVLIVSSLHVVSQVSLNPVQILQAGAGEDKGETARLVRGEEMEIYVC